MIGHSELGSPGFGSNKALKLLIDSGKVILAGNRRLKIYGLLSCASGKRLKTSHRVFFLNEAEAINEGFRPCGACMKQKYQQWLNLHSQKGL